MRVAEINEGASDPRIQRGGDVRAAIVRLFGAFVWSGLRYIHTHRLRWLLLANLTGIGAEAFRLAFVSVAWIAAFTLPLLAQLWEKATKRLLQHVVLSLVFTDQLPGLHEN